HRLMARRAALLGARAALRVRGVVEARVEALERGELLERRVLRAEVCVAVQAERAVRSEELGGVTVRASLVTGQRRVRGVVSTPVARVARERRVALRRVREDLRAFTLNTRLGVRHARRGR